MNCKPCDNSLDVTAFLSVISEQNRLKILCLLKQGELCVCELVEKLDLPQNLLSHHLKNLRDFGLLESRKQGQYVYYHIQQDRLDYYLGLTNLLLAKKETPR